MYVYTSYRVLTLLLYISGSMILSGGSDGLIAVSSPTTGVTARVIGDHKGAPITNIDVTNKQVNGACF